jgi:hypothetical protein
MLILNQCKIASHFVKIIVACPHRLPKLPKSTQRKQAIPNKGSLFYSHCEQNQKKFHCTWSFLAFLLLRELKQNGQHSVWEFPQYGFLKGFLVINLNISAWASLELYCWISLYILEARTTKPPKNPTAHEVSSFFIAQRAKTISFFLNTVIPID